MDLYEVSQQYVSYLRKFDSKVLSNSGDKGNRKYIGIIVKRGKYNYIVPLSSPKYPSDFTIDGYTGTHLPPDFSFGNYESKIHMQKSTSEPVIYMTSTTAKGTDFFGKIKCSSMIPVPVSELTKIDVNHEPDSAYKALLFKQINFIRTNEIDIVKKHVNVVYYNKINNIPKGYVIKATVDFALLEQKCDEWEASHKS